MNLYRSVLEVRLTFVSSSIYQISDHGDNEVNFDKVHLRRRLTTRRRRVIGKSTPIALFFAELSVSS